MHPFLKKAQEVNATLIAKGYEVRPYKIEITKIGSSAGRAYFSKALIKINPIFFETQWDDMLNETLPHEISHLVAFWNFDDRGHGKGWKRIMRDLGLEPERCHNYDLAAAGLNYKTVFCHCGHHSLSVKSFNKMTSGSRFICKKCRSVLTTQPRIDFGDIPDFEF